VTFSLVLVTNVIGGTGRQFSILSSRHISSRRTSTIRRLRDPNRTIYVSLIRLRYGRRQGGGSRERYVQSTTRIARRGRVILSSERKFAGFLSSVFRHRHRFPVRDTSISGIPARVSSPRTSSAITRIRARTLLGCMCVYVRMCARARAYIYINARNNSSVSDVLIDSFVYLHHLSICLSHWDGNNNNNNCFSFTHQTLMILIIKS